MISISSAALRYGWRFVLLKPKSKAPLTPEGHHVYTDVAGAREHLAAGGNLGLCGHNLTVLDWDDDAARVALFDALGPLPPTVLTGSGKYHSYVAGDPTLPGVIRMPDGTHVGEIRRRPTEYVVCPPSVHPDTGRRYELLIEPELGPLPAPWVRYLRAAASASRDACDGTGFVEPAATDRITAPGRHRLFFRWTRSWKAQGIPLDNILDVLLAANRKICDPPIPDADLAGYIRRCYHQPDAPAFARGGAR
jgi:hypothetical protein